MRVTFGLLGWSFAGPVVEGAKSVTPPENPELLRAIAAAPDDDLPRLVYADWLDENGQDVRAEFIRVQCQIAGLEADRERARPAHAVLWDRQNELRRGHLGELLGPLVGLAGAAEMKFDRGFVNRVVLPVATFLDLGDRLSGLLPRPQVRVEGVGADFLGFTESSYLDVMTELYFYANELATNSLNYLSISTNAIDLRSAAKRLTRLEILDFEGCGLTDEFCGMFAELSFPTLVELDLSYNQITDVGVADLLQAVLPRRLILGGNPISDQGAFELADRLKNSPVQYLNLRGTLIGRAGHAALLATFDRKDKKVDLF